MHKDFVVKFRNLLGDYESWLRSPYMEKNSYFCFSCPIDLVSRFEYTTSCSTIMTFDLDLNSVPAQLSLNQWRI